MRSFGVFWIISAIAITVTYGINSFRKKEYLPIQVDEDRDGEFHKL